MPRISLVCSYRRITFRKNISPSVQPRPQGHPREKPRQMSGASRADGPGDEVALSFEFLQMAAGSKDSSKTLFMSMGEMYGWFKEPVDTILAKLSAEINELGIKDSSANIGESSSKDCWQENADKEGATSVLIMDSDSDVDHIGSLRERLFKTMYNAEESPGYDDDFEMFLDEVHTAKPPKLWSYNDRKISHSNKESSLDNFIVDDDSFPEEDDDPFYCGPSCQDKDGPDKENMPFTPFTVDSQTPFRIPVSNGSCGAQKISVKSGLDSSACKQDRSCSALEKLLTPYSSQKHFKKSRDIVVNDLFRLYNDTVFENKLPHDFKITWNNKMRSTAGYCYYSRIDCQRGARIELADKVIDSSDRLRDTLIHEMCHAAAWIISGVRAGHGPVWKQWVRKANFVHQDLPPISTCHTYSINTKYNYRCTNPACGNSFGRHSKSVDLEKSRCAYCHSRIEMVPQLKKDGTPQRRAPNKFAIFVKENFARVKRTNKAFAHKDVMKQLSVDFAKLSTS